MVAKKSKKKKITVKATAKKSKTGKTVAKKAKVKKTATVKKISKKTTKTKASVKKTATVKKTSKKTTKTKASVKKTATVKKDSTVKPSPAKESPTKKLKPSPKKTTTTRKRKTSQKNMGPSAEEVKLWQKLSKQNEGKKTPSYDMTKTYGEINAIKHNSFGLGFIVDRYDNRLKVLFEEGTKTLISNYKN